ncbi:unnamed protein product [Diatraea saccharalis]|uniref:Myotubularin phosphatase domain-containing protein n=1 Tax=Diatraea saccharalis TaxID=40085 RepID=A0A9N9R7G1_9NEOP|nr:unnamed protein product [Diatraea saccharalis]
MAATDAAEHLSNNVTVVLQEGDGVDYCAVVSSLTQLMLDPHFRTISGFQSLIQKEWVALGHPFCDSLVQRPVWDWGEQFSEEDKALFENPLYACQSIRLPSQRISQYGGPSSPTRLVSAWSVGSVEVWSACYERWLSPLDVGHAGDVQYHVHNMYTYKEVPSTMIYIFLGFRNSIHKKPL